MLIVLWVLSCSVCCYICLSVQQRCNFVAQTKCKRCVSAFTVQRVSLAFEADTSSMYRFNHQWLRCPSDTLASVINTNTHTQKKNSSAKDVKAGNYPYISLTNCRPAAFGHFHPSVKAAKIFILFIYFFPNSGWPWKWQPSFQFTNSFHTFFVPDFTEMNWCGAKWTRVLERKHSSSESVDVQSPTFIFFHL